MIKRYSRVQLVTDKYKEEGGRVGMIGYVIETYIDGKYEVEFSNSNGVTLAQLAVGNEDIILFSEKKHKDSES